MAIKKSRKLCGLVIDSYLTDIALTAVKRDAKFGTRYVKGAPFVNRRYSKEVGLLCQKWYVKGQGV